jgi:hypothetical protein
MNRRSLLLTILSLTAAGITGAQAQSAFTNVFIQNGDMGSFQANGIPTDWLQNGGDNSSQTNNNSPFVNAYANNSSAVSLTRDGNNRGIIQNFSTTTNYQKLSVNFDFMVTTTNGGTARPWGIQFDGGGASGVASSAVHYRVDQSGYFTINAGPSTGVFTNIMKLDAGAWYNVQAYFEVTAINTGNGGADSPFTGAGFQNGTITRQSDFSSTNPLSASWNNVATLSSTLGYSRVNIYDRNGALGSPSTLVVDNIAAVVPEPSEYALMALGLGLTTLVILRRRKEGQAS